MNRPIMILMVACFVVAFVAEETLAQRRGGGGGRSVSRGAARAPSMSRSLPNRSQASRPSISRPNVSPSGNRPNVQKPNTNRPNIQRPSVNIPKSPPGGIRPNIGAATNRPSANRPDLGNNNRPNIGSGNRPNIGGSNRPNLGNNNRPGRPSAGDLGDFLDLPGSTRPPQRPDSGNRLGSNRSDIDINGQGLGNRANIGNRTTAGNININAGNSLTINKQNNINSMRNHWSNVGVNNRPFNQNWWANHPTTLPGWNWHGNWNRYSPGWCWRPCAWATFGTWFAWSWSQPVTYSYGSNVVYRDNYVYIDNQQVATAADYYQQAETVANNIPENVNADQIEWMPLGVFAISDENATDTGMLLQLAVSKEGIVAGTFYNDLADISRPVEGTVDRESQRAAWRFSDDKNTEIVMETAIYNLTQDESSALVHFGADRQETWLMVRLPEPSDDGN